MRIEGRADEGYGALADGFASMLPQDGRGGGAVALFVGGEPVVDLWGGTADVRTGKAWEKETTGQILSCSKGIVSILAHHLAQEGRIDLDVPLARYWPEFARDGKEAITLRQVMSHRAGLPAIDAPLSFEDVLDWGTVVAALERQTPLWEPGEAFAYHGLTFGWLVGEVIRRVTGLTPGGYFRELLGDPLGLGTWIGLPGPEFDRLARLEGPEEPMPLPPPDSLFHRTLTVNGVLDFPGIDNPHGYTAPALLAAELPAVNGVSTARGLAATYAAAATGVGGRPRLLTEDTVTDAVRELSSGVTWPDGLDTGGHYGTGFLLDSSSVWNGLGPRTFGHDGVGGTTAFGDDEFGVGFAYVSSRLGRGDADESVDPLVDAVRRSLG